MRKLLFASVITLLILSGILWVTPSVARADDMTCPPPTMVSIDIKPGNAQNRVKLSSKGTLAVAVLGSDPFDASQFTPEMAHLNDVSTAETAGCSGAAATRWTWEDENGDGRPDLVFFFNTQDTNLTPSSTAATLMAHGSYAGTDMHIEGTDAV